MKAMQKRDKTDKKKIKSVTMTLQEWRLRLMNRDRVHVNGTMKKRIKTCSGGERKETLGK